MCGQRATGRIQRNNYHHGSCGPSSRTGLIGMLKIVEREVAFRVELAGLLGAKIRSMHLVPSLPVKTARHVIIFGTDQ